MPRQGFFDSMRNQLCVTLALLALATPLSGCLSGTDDVAPAAALTAGDTTAANTLDLGKMGWALGPLGNLAGVTRTSVALGIIVPEEATRLTVTIALERGVTHGLELSGIVGCTTTFPTSQSVVDAILTVTCDAPPAGLADVTLRHTSGHMQGTLHVTAETN